MNISPEDFLESKNINKNFNVKCNQWKDTTRVVDLLTEFCRINKRVISRPKTTSSLESMERNTRIWHLEKELEKLKKLPN